MTAQHETRSRSAKAKALLGGLSILVVGAVLGVALDRHLSSSRLHGGAAELHDATMASMSKRLQLAPAQRQQIDSIVAARHHVLQQTWETLHTQLGAAVDTVHRDIEAVLTPEQRKQFRSWLRSNGPAQLHRPR